MACQCHTVVPRASFIQEVRLTWRRVWARHMALKGPELCYALLDHWPCGVGPTGRSFPSVLPGGNKENSAMLCPLAPGLGPPELSRASDSAMLCWVIGRAAWPDRAVCLGVTSGMWTPGHGILLCWTPGGARNNCSKQLQAQNNCAKQCNKECCPKRLP